MYKRKRSIGHFGKYHNTLCLSPHILHKPLFLFSLGTIVSPRRSWKQCLCKILGGQTKSIMIFSEVAYCLLSCERGCGFVIMLLILKWTVKK